MAVPGGQVEGRELASRQRQELWAVGDEEVDLQRRRKEPANTHVLALLIMALPDYPLKQGLAVKCNVHY